MKTFKTDLKPSFIKLLNPPVETISERGSPLSGNDDFDGKAHKRRRDTIGKENSKRIKEDDSSDDDDSSISGSVDEWESKVIDSIVDLWIHEFKLDSNTFAISLPVG